MTRGGKQSIFAATGARPLPIPPTHARADLDYRARPGEPFGSRVLMLEHV
ncbi:MAG: hypothetical protein JWP83_5472 [Mycobacterium sp.]|jgi:hypothetical protein|nr:hypothetical protein [Mycobacterium sp.]